MRTLGRAQARRCALHAQGFGARFRPRGRVRREHLRAVIERLRVVQIDSVNVVTRSHYLPFYSRLGVYDPALLDALRDGDAPVRHVERGQARRAVVEYWAHEASLVALEDWPLYGFRMNRAREESWGSMRGVAREHPDLVSAVRHAIRSAGPSTAREIEAILEHEGVRAPGWGWRWSLVKAACEHLFWAGEVTSAGRTAQFERRYADVASVLPSEVLVHGPAGSDPVVDPFEALLDLAGRALGVGTEQCLRDYMRLRPAQARPALARLVEAGRLEPVEVAGWRRPAYLHAEAHIPARVRARALLSPFDSLIWQRDRTRALFGFDYRLEIYVPAAQRVHGYYVLPFLLGDRLVARVDLKADRAGGVLRARSIHWEPGAHSAAAADELADELADLARFLRLSVVEGVAVWGDER